MKTLVKQSNPLLSGRALRSALEKGNELQSAQLRTTRTEALAEPQDGFDAESALVAQGDADVHVFEKVRRANAESILECYSLLDGDCRR